MLSQGQNSKNVSNFIQNQNIINFSSTFEQAQLCNKSSQKDGF